MTHAPMVQTYRLAITRVEQTCLFELTWGEGMQLTAKVPYPEELTRLYQSWQRTYANYHRTLQTTDETGGLSAFRGRTGAVGQVPVAQTDLRGQLAQAEVLLLNAFHRWLESRDLIGIRGQLNTWNDKLQGPITLYISCSAMELRRLPWEAWELAKGFGQRPPIRIARLPVNIPVAANPPKKRRRQARALVIIGDDTGLNFEADLAAIDRLKTLVEIQKIGWKQGKNIDDLIREIRDRIRDPMGWDMVFFFGHSNEAAGLGGEIAIAPKTTLYIRDLEADLTTAKHNGLQFALFNSCKGLDIANRLVALGLNQVVIMREPIHNQVAQYFLLQFLTRLTQYDDVHTALQEATKALKIDKAMAYPSAYLVPSLFSHRGATLFQLRPLGWRAKLTDLLPSQRQGVALGVIAMLSLLSPVRDNLMASRLWSQAIYHHVTRRPLQSEVTPPVVLIHIDDTSIIGPQYEGDADRINQDYLAKLLDQLVELDSQVIGIDYVLDQKQTDRDIQLAQSIQKAVGNNTWIVFASELKNGQELGAQPILFNPYWSMQGYTNAPPWYLKALQIGQYCERRCPFSYLLATTHGAVTRLPETSFTLSLERTSDLRNHLFDIVAQENNDRLLQELFHYRLSPVLSLSRWLEQRWFQPILDFSIPLEHIFDRVPAHELLSQDLKRLSDHYDWQNQVILIGAGDYYRATPANQGDYVKNPPAIQFWRDRVNDDNNHFTGVEGHAYTIHHFLNRHWVMPIPNLWMVGLGIWVGAISAVMLQRDKRLQPYRWQGLLGFSIGYGLIVMVVYGLAAIVVPWLLPTAAVWVYHIPSLQRSTQESHS